MSVKLNIQPVNSLRSNSTGCLGLLAARPAQRSSRRDEFRCAHSCQNPLRFVKRDKKFIIYSFPYLGKVGMGSNLNRVLNRSPPWPSPSWGGNNIVYLGLLRFARNDASCHPELVSGSYCLRNLQICSNSFPRLLRRVAPRNDVWWSCVRRTCTKCDSEPWKNLSFQLK